jgi:TfoX/Sxy family transcriptional regulator of competence genes
LVQMSKAGTVTAKSMFGEYGIYCDGKIVALFCDDQLFVKPTQAGKAFIQDPVEAPPYPGAKPYFLVEERVEDRDWISELIRITAKELPPPKTKSKGTMKTGKSGGLTNRSSGRRPPSGRYR